MARSSECTEQYAQKTLDTADIVREACSRQLWIPRCIFWRMAEAYRVFVVLDRDYGRGLSALTQTGPVWIVDTPLNRSVAQSFWAANPNRSHLDGVTTFKFGVDASPEDNLI